MKESSNNKCETNTSEEKDEQYYKVKSLKKFY